MGAKSVVVIGLGNIGSYFVPILARMLEVGRVVLADRDSYERRNSINQNISPRDSRRPKALVQAQRLRELRLDLEVIAYHAPLENLPLGVWRADVVAACLDSRRARQAAAERAWHMGTPWLDSGVLASECLARANVYLPAAGAPCMECAWSDEDYRLIEQQYPCDGGAVAVAPTGASSELGALAAALLANECRKMLTGEFDHALIGRQAALNARWHRLSVTSFRRNPNCRFDHAVWNIEPLPTDTRTTRIADLLELAGTIRVPGQRFVQRLVCSTCRAETPLFHLEGSLTRKQRACGGCRQPMKATGFDIVESLSCDLPAKVREQTLDQAGLRYGDVIQADDRYFEIVPKIVIQKKNRSGFMNLSTGSHDVI